MTNLKISTEETGGVLVIHLEGFLDAHNHVLFRKAIEEAMNRKTSRMVVDFSKLVYVGSSGIEVILSVIQKLRDEGGDMVLCGISSKIFKVFDLLGLTTLLKITDSVEDALKCFDG